MVKSKKQEDTKTEEMKNNNITEETNDSNNPSGEENRKSFEGEEKRGGDRRKQDRRSGERREGAVAQEDSEVSMLRNQITEKENEAAKLQTDLASMKDLMLRRQADFENYKKRMAKLQEDNKKFAIRDIALDVVEINDDLLRALDASSTVTGEGETCNEAHASFVQGVSMISKRIESILQKYGVVEIEALNQEFDPNCHEAIEIEVSDSVEKDTVTMVHQKGFRIEDLVIRSSKVKVTKPAPKGDCNGGTGSENN